MAVKITRKDVEETLHLPAKEAAKKLGVHKASIYRAREKYVRQTDGTVSGNSDGSSNYVFSSDEAWGYEDFRKFIKSRGQDPDDVTFTWGVTSNPAGGFWNKLNNVKPKPVTDRKLTEEDLPALYASVKKRKPSKGIGSSKRTTVVVWADPQIGKVAKRGGTPELIDRSNEKRAKLRELLRDRNPSGTVLLDAGDGFEGFESGGNPMFTNDLSLAGQMDLYGTEMMEWIKELEYQAPVLVACVPSNHTAWRNGKQNLGNPQDDLGLFMHRQVEKLATASGLRALWAYPADYDESNSVRIYDTVIGLVHGNQFGNGQAVSWWEKQTFGAQAVASADILVTGHYHSFGAGVAGRNPVSGRQRWWLGAPTLDNGSDWFRQKAGRDSDPGVLVFDITEDGFDLGSLMIL